jgi:AraC-like DNA-binding protein
VRTFAEREVNSPVLEIVQPYPATLDYVLAFDFLGGLPILEYCDGRPGETYQMALVGPYTSRRANFRLRGIVDSFGIFFQPFGFWRLFGIPSKECVNNAHAADDVLGKQMRELWERLAESKSFKHRVDVAEVFLSSALARASKRTHIMNSAHHLIHVDPNTPVSELARVTGLSVRQYERRFEADAGMSPKLYARITRYLTALDLKLARPTRSWLGIAHDTGYCDQMHMVKEFQLLAGAPPERLFAELVDARPL